MGMKLKVRFKRLDESATMPLKAHASDAGYDLTATSVGEDEFGNIVYGTGIAVEIPEGYMGLVFPRSSNANKALLLTNSVGVIDSGYRGEILMKFRRTFENPMMYQEGDRIGQLIILPHPNVDFVESDNLSKSERGTGGYGSTGK